MGVLGVILGRGEFSWSALFFSAYNAISRGNDEAIIVRFQSAPPYRPSTTSNATQFIRTIDTEFFFCTE